MQGQSPTTKWGVPTAPASRGTVTEPIQPAHLPGSLHPLKPPAAFPSLPLSLLTGSTSKENPEGQKLVLGGGGMKSGRMLFLKM